MNRPIRRLGVAVGVLLLALLVNLNYVQVVKSSDYRTDPENHRVLLDEYARQRGSIVVQGVSVASSISTTDRLRYLRTYSNGPVYADLTGYYSMFYGTTGMEAAAEPLLSGNDNRLFVSKMSALLTGRDPSGGNVVLTINRKAQEAAYRAMAGRPGAVVALDPSTGAILAAVSTPSYDPDKLSSHNPDSIEAAYNTLAKDAGQPLTNRAFSVLYPPGSVFKIVVAAAALDKGRTPATVLSAPDKLRLPQTTTSLQNYAGESCGAGQKATLDHALTISCNTAFAKLAMELGDSAIRDQAAAFGIDDRPATVPLPVAASTIGPIIDQAALAQSAIGQRDVRVTPLEAAALSAAVADGGVLMRPYLVAQQLAPNLSVLSSATPEVESTAMTDDHARELTTMMEHVVTGGTGTGAQIAGVRVAGKTGTADTGEKTAAGGAEPPHAWFSGFAPADKPRIAVAVVLEHGGVTGSETTGGKAAAPVAAAVMKAYLAAIGN